MLVPCVSLQSLSVGVNALCVTAVYRLVLVPCVSLQSLSVGVSALCITAVSVGWC